jgi:hypothetical protein
VLRQKYCKGTDQDLFTKVLSLTQSNLIFLSDILLRYHISNLNPEFSFWQQNAMSMVSFETNKHYFASQVPASASMS